MLIATARKRPRGTRTDLGSYARPPRIRIAHVPAASRIVNRPAPSVSTVRVAGPRTNEMRRCFAGAVHGEPVMQTGAIGPRVTVPCSPPAGVAKARNATATAVFTTEVYPKSDG